MSLDPALPPPARLGGGSGPVADPGDGGTFAARPGWHKAPWETDPDVPAVERIQIWPLREGDRVLVDVAGAAGMSAGGADRIGRQVRAALKLDELGFDVPVLVVSPGIRVEVIRPS